VLRHNKNFTTKLTSTIVLQAAQWTNVEQLLYLITLIR